MVLSTVTLMGTELAPCSMAVPPWALLFLGSRERGPRLGAEREAGRASGWSLRKIRAEGRDKGKTRGTEEGCGWLGNCPPPHLSCQLWGLWDQSQMALGSRLLEDSRAVTLQSLAASAGM